MKRISAILIGLFTLIFVSKADDRPVKFEQLPKAAQKFVKANFSGVNVLAATKDDDLIAPEYEVILDNGVRLDFKNDGSLEKIKSSQAGVPAAIIPVKIREYITKHYPGVIYREYEVDKTGYDVKLSNGLELRFNTSFHLVDIDD